MTTQERGRDVLPIPDRPYTGLIKYDAKDPEALFPKTEQLRPPEGAPNVVLVLLDDVGFGAASAFGGPCQTPAANTKYKSFSVTAELVVPAVGAEGVIATQGGAFGGWSLYAKEGVLKYCYNFIGLDLSYVEADLPLQPGERQVRLEFKYDGGGLGKGADLLLLVEGEKVGEGRTERSIPYLISLDETLDIGTDTGTPATDDYPARGNEFNGVIKWVQVDLEPDDHSHMIDMDHMAHVRLVKQ
jgi:arylsulfatase